jgi:FtsH-binding integral membrane protein
MYSHKEEVKMDMNTGVFERSGFDTMSERAFYFAIGISMLWGTGITALIAGEVAKSGFEPGIMSILILGLAIPYIGIWISVSSSNPIISFVGYNMVCLPFGAILAPIVNHYSPQLIQNACMATCCVTATMMCLSMIYPGFFSQLGGVLFSALIGLLVVRCMQIFIPSLAHMSLLDWIGAGIFSLYIGYDWYRATSVPKTLDNALDISIELYLDIINLFLILLRLMGDGESDD